MKNVIDNLINSIEKQKTADKVTVLAATKCVEPEKIDALFDAGITEIGENRVQELLEKYDKVTKPFNWHFIGRLQTNKVKYIIDKVKIIESVDSQRLAVEIDKQAARRGVTMPVLVEINAGGEQDKGGVLIGQAQETCDFVSALKNLCLKGIMCVFPKNAPEELYAQCGQLFSLLKQRYPDFTVLSMGMSSDYLLAVKNGSNEVRLGSAIFGKRNYERIK